MKTMSEQRENSKIFYCETIYDALSTIYRLVRLSIVREYTDLSWN